MEKLVFKFKWNHRETPTVRTVREKNNVRGFTTPHFKADCKVTVIKIKVTVTQTDTLTNGIKFTV